MNEHLNDTKHATMTFFRSVPFQRVLIGVGIFVIALLIFQAGVFVGFRKASFSFQGGDNYYRAFGEERRGPMQGMMHEGFPSAGGSIGRILTLALPTLVVEDRDGVEKTIRLSEDTVIRRGKDTLTPSLLKADDFIIVIGEPNAGAEIEAKLVRLLPPPPGMDKSLPFERATATTTQN